MRMTTIFGRRGSAAQAKAGPVHSDNTTPATGTRALKCTRQRFIGGSLSLIGRVLLYRQFKVLSACGGPGRAREYSSFPKKDSRAGSTPSVWWLPVYTTSTSLLGRLRQPGERQAWQRFTELYTPLLYYWARRLGMQPSDAADLVQEVFALL